MRKNGVVSKIRKVIIFSILVDFLAAFFFIFYVVFSENRETER